MKLIEFLNAVVPQDGVRIAARQKTGNREGGKTFSYFQHLPCNSHEELQQGIAQIVKATKSNVYFALASYKQGFHENKRGKKVIRVRQNVKKLKALWFDIDFKDGLSNPTEVVAALREFSNATGMPVPSILVHSGNGMHCYWPLQTEITYEEWDTLAKSLKEHALSANLAIDPTCTADPARVLRPPGSINWKDPDNPKIVKGAFTGQLFDAAALRAALLGSSAAPATDSLGDVPRFLEGVVDAGSIQSLCGTAGQTNTVKYYWSEIVRQCGVANHYTESAGRDCTEPEWTAGLQLLRHCADGELYVHDISKGHPEYDPDATNDKWQQRMENDAGPTLCDTFRGYRQEICGSCPHNRKIKTPLVLGEEKQVTLSGKDFPLRGWRIAEDGHGMEKSVWDKESNQYVWERVLKRQWELHSASRGLEDNRYTYIVHSTLDNGDITVVPLPGNGLSNNTVISDTLSELGVPLLRGEMESWKTLMATWLEHMQRNRQQQAAVTTLGWMEDKSSGSVHRVGFTAGDTVFYKDGSSRAGLRATERHREFAYHYNVTGEYDVWKKVAQMIVDQNNPVFTAVLASAFAAPLIGYTGLTGGTMTVVSPESGLGKSSAMKLAQSVWSEPQTTMLGPSDTYNSTIGKVGFLKNLPLYWDEIRNDETLQNFNRVAFDVAQGKERSRMDSNSNIRTQHTWRTMCVGASNQSLFDYMAEQSGKSDAGPARAFELTLAPFNAPNRAAMQILFSGLNDNYGHAGQDYARWLAPNELRCKEEVARMNESLWESWGFHEGERFWCGICASLICGAQYAKEAGIVDIDIKTMAQFLKDTVALLRMKSKGHLDGISARELVIGYMQHHQQHGMQVDQFKNQGARDEPVVKVPPKDRLLYIWAADGRVRVRKQDFGQWLKSSKRFSLTEMEREFTETLDMKEMHTILAGNTRWQLPKSRVLEFKLGAVEDSVMESLNG